METQEESRVTVVTSENFESYVKEKLGGSTAADPVAEAEAAEESFKEAQKETPKEVSDEEIEHPDERKRGRLQERFSELTKARKDAEERATKAAEDAKKAREDAEAKAKEAEELRRKYEPPKEELAIGPEPQPSQFNDVTEYSKALKDWTAEHTRIEDAKAAKAVQAEQEAAKAKAEWAKRQTEFRKEAADYDEVIGSSEVKVSDPVRDAIIESDAGPAILYHLAKNADFAKELGQMSVIRALREIGKLEVKLGEKKAPPPATKPIAEISSAPPPIAPLKGANSPVTNNVDANGNFLGTYEEYKRLRSAGKIR